MNPNIAHGLMLARIAEMHRQARRVDTGRTARTTLTRIRWCVIGLIATAMVFLVGVPAAQATDVPPPGENSGAGTVGAYPSRRSRRHGGLADRADRSWQCPAGLRAHPARRPGGPACHPGAALPLLTRADRWISARPPQGPAARTGPAPPPARGGLQAPGLTERVCGVPIRSVWSATRWSGRTVRVPVHTRHCARSWRDTAAGTAG